MATLLEITTQIVSARALTTPMTTEEIIQELKTVYAYLQHTRNLDGETGRLSHRWVDKKPIVNDVEYHLVGADV